MSLLSAEFLAPFCSRPKNAGFLFDVTYLRTYSRFLEDKKRRERWNETVERVTNYNVGLYQGPKSKKELIKEAELMYDKVYNLEVYPAGRALFVGGTKSSEKWPESCFNCCGLVMDRLEAFCDLFHLLMLGCGVGFRILKEDIEKLPKLNPNFKIKHLEYNTLYPKNSKDETIVNYDWDFRNIKIGDSKEGWTQALREFFNILLKPGYQTILFDYDFIRPSGSRINGFGGRAPGHEGLKEMFSLITEVIKECNGELTPTAVMDINNIIAKNVLVGGVRRSSQIALGSPDDYEFIDAKVDYKKKGKKWRNMSNNSIVFTEKPTKEKVAEILERIKTSWEPGFLNYGKTTHDRRDYFAVINPCISSDTWILTDKGPRQVRDLLGIPFYALVNGEKHYSPVGFWKTGNKKLFKLKTDLNMELNLTEDHKVLTSRGWIEAKNLNTEDSIFINKNINPESWIGEGTFKEGWILGNLIGDGNFGSGIEGQLRYWGETREIMAEQALAFVNSELKTRTKLKIVKRDVPSCNYLQISSREIGRLAERFGIVKGNKVTITPQIEKASFEFYKGFLQGVFDADGSPQGGKNKGFSVRLSQSNLPFLKGVQRMLIRMGIVSKVYDTRKAAGFTLLPDSKRNLKSYPTKAFHELIISRDNMIRFKDLINFSEPNRKERLENYILSLVKSPYKGLWMTKFKSLEYIGKEDVYDCHVENINRFDANGLIIHNCGEAMLADMGNCNLSGVVLPLHIENKTINYEKLETSIRLATRIGMRQTNVTWSLPEWDKVHKRDRLLGVSMTGIMDALDELEWEFDQPEAIRLWEFMHWAANDEADRYAFEMRIPRPMLVTILKPEGSISQLATVSSGLHRSHAPHYIRRIRVSSIDPICKALQILGVPNEPDLEKAERTIFSFPIKTKARTTTYEEPARRQFERYLTLMKYYVDHNASCTLSIGDGEWEEMKDLIYEHWDNIVACAFSTKDPNESQYKQLPYEIIDVFKYIEMISTFPDLSKLGDIVDQLENGTYEEYEPESDCKAGFCSTR